MRVFFNKWKWRIVSLFRPRNVIRLRGMGRFSWMDVDGKMELALIQLFIDYIEEEKPFEYWDTENSPHKENWDRVKKLYEWFKFEYPRVVDIRDRLGNNSWHGLESHVLDEQVINPKLKEIIELREHYWT